MVRRNFIPEGKIDSTLTPYADAMMQLVTEEKVPLVDLHQRSRELVERLGLEKTKTFGPPHPTRPGQFDNTHLSPAGAEYSKFAWVTVQGQFHRVGRQVRVSVLSVECPHADLYPLPTT